MPDPARVIVIPEWGLLPIVAVQLQRDDGGMSHLSALLDGLPEEVEAPAGKMTIAGVRFAAWRDEEGERLHKPVNMRATALLIGVLPVGGRLVGDVALTGVADDGAVIDLPEALTVEIVEALVTLKEKR